MNLSIPVQLFPCKGQDPIYTYYGHESEVTLRWGFTPRGLQKVVKNGKDLNTPPKTGVDTQNYGLEKVAPFKYGHCSYLC